jgi:hypothetical protein
VKFNLKISFFYCLDFPKISRILIKIPCLSLSRETNFSSPAILVITELIEFFFSNLQCCSGHRRFDPYGHIEAKVHSLENINYVPSMPELRVNRTEIYWPSLKKKKHINMPIVLLYSLHHLTLPTFPIYLRFLKSHMCFCESPPSACLI